MPQYRLHTDLSEEAYAENLAKIASELSILEPIEGSFLCPICDKSCTPLNKILGRINIASLKKKWIFKQSAAPTLTMLAGAAWAAGINMY